MNTTFTMVVVETVESVAGNQHHQLTFTYIHTRHCGIIVLSADTTTYLVEVSLEPLTLWLLDILLYLLTHSGPKSSHLLLLLHSDSGAAGTCPSCLGAKVGNTLYKAPLNHRATWTEQQPFTLALTVTRAPILTNMHVSDFVKK